MQFENLEMAKSQISLASKILAEVIQKRNREESTTKTKKDSFSKAYHKLYIGILGDMLSQAACLENWYYTNTVTLSWYKDAEHCVFHIDSKVSSNDIIVTMNFDDASDVLQTVYDQFRTLDNFSASRDSKQADKCIFFMNVWHSTILCFSDQTAVGAAFMTQSHELSPRRC